jgi:hypothetical protein
MEKVPKVPTSRAIPVQRMSKRIWGRPGRPAWPDFNAQIGLILLIVA